VARREDVFALKLTNFRWGGKREGVAQRHSRVSPERESPCERVYVGDSVYAREVSLESCLYSRFTLGVTCVSVSL
jgi:hypothetical protein